MNDDIFFQALQQRQTLFGNVAEPSLGPDLPIPTAWQQGTTGMLAGMAWQLYSPQLYQQFGFVPGIFEPRGNITSQFAAREYWQARNRAMMQASQSDRANMLRTARGLARSAGVQFGQTQQQMLSAGLDWADSMGLTMMAASVMPDTFDALGGSRGSATVMGARIHQAGRFLADPITGRVGLSGDTAGVMTNEIYQRLYGAGVDINKMYGIGAGRAGELAQALEQRGLLARGIGTFDTAGQLEQLRGDQDLVRQGLQTLRTADQPRFQQLLQQYSAQTGRSAGTAPTEQIRNLATLEAGTTAAIQALKDSGSPQFEAALRQFDATRVAQQLHSTSKAITAMRDIFGDAGHHNAPMTVLLEGLNALTQGGLVSKSPGEAERIVRTSYLAAKDAGIGLTQLMGLTAQSAQEAENLGLTRSIGVTAAEASIAFGGALGRAGDGRFAAFGMHDREHVMEQDRRLRLQAARSNLSNLLSAAARLDAASPFAENTEAARLLRDVRAGQDTVEIGGVRKPLWQLQREDFLQAMVRSGVSADTAGMVIGDTRSNMEFSSQFNDIVRRQQAAEMANTSMGRSFANSITQRLARVGLTGADAHNTALRMGAAVSQSLLGMSAEDRTNRRRRTSLMAEALRGQLAQQAELTADEQKEITRLQGRGLSEQEARRRVVDPKFTDQELLTTVEAGWGNFEQTVISMGYGSAQDFLRLNDPAVMQQKAKEDRHRDLRRRIDQSLAPLNRVSAFRRLMDQMAEPDDTFMHGVLKVLGGVKTEQISALLQPIELTLRGANATNDQQLIEALKTGGAAADEQIKQMAVARQTDLQGLQEQFKAARAQFEQITPNLSAEQRQRLLTGQETVAAPQIQAQINQLRPQLLAEQKLLALQTAKARGGTQSILAGSRLTAQLQALKYTREQLDKLGINADPAVLERWVKRQEALMSGGKEAQAAAEELQAEIAAQPQVAPQMQQLLQTLQQSAEENGIDANLQLATDAEGDQLTSAGLSRWADAEANAALNAKLNLRKDAERVSDDDYLASRRQAEALREDAVANLQTDKEAFKALGKRKNREKGDKLGELSANALIGTVTENQRKLEERAQKLGFKTTAEAVFASKDKQLQELHQAAIRNMEEVQSRLNATEEEKEAIKLSELTQFETRKQPKEEAAPTTTAADILKYEKQRQQIEYFRRTSAQGDPAGNAAWAALPEEERKALIAIDKELQEKGQKKEETKVAETTDKGVNRIQITGEATLIGNDRIRVNFQEVPGAGPSADA